MTKLKLNRILCAAVAACVFISLLTSCEVGTRADNSSAASSQAGPVSTSPSGLHPAFTAKDSQYGYIDDSGNFVIKQQFLSAGDFNADGYAVVTAASGLQGVIDKRGDYSIKPAYHFGDHFVDGMNIFDVYDGDDVKAGMIDLKGRIIISPVYQSLGYFSEGIAVAQDYTQNKAGYEDYVSYALDGSGKLLFKCDGSVGAFSDGLALLQDNKSKLYGYIDKSGKIVIKPQYYYAEDFKNGAAEVEITGNHYYDIDRTGKILDKKSSGDINMYYQRFDDGSYIKNYSYDSSSLFDKSSSVLIDKVNGILRVDDSYFAATQRIQTSTILDESDMLKAVFDDKGERLTDYIYYDINELQKGLIAVNSNNETYLIDENLKEITGFKRLQGAWALTLSGDLVKAVSGSSIRYFTKQGKPVFRSDGDFRLSNGAELSSETYTPRRLINIKYPRISSLKNPGVQNAINTKLKNYFIDGDVEKAVRDDTQAYSLNFTFSEISDILAVQASGSSGFAEASSAAPKEIQKNYYFDMKTGSEYTLDDLFKKDSDYKAYIEKMTFHIKGDFQRFANGSTKAKYDRITGFTVDKDGIELYYMVYSLSGQPTYYYDVTYSQLDSHIDKSGAFWKNISQWKS